MEKPDSASGSGGSNVDNTVFIDTSLDTHLAMVVSDSDTVFDLKKKILYEHPACFPNIGEIKINALKVKRKGYLYHLLDSMFVKSAFDGVSKSWFLSVDASSSDECRENYNSCKPDAANVVACFGITTNNSLADVVDLLPAGPSKILSNINDVPLPQDGNNCRTKQSCASQQVAFSNSSQENPEDLHMEVEHTADVNSMVLSPATDKESRPKVQGNDVGDNKQCEDLPASVAASVLKVKHKIKKRNKDAICDRDVKENCTLVVESGKHAFHSDNVLKENPFENGRSAVLNDMNVGNQIRVNETCKSLSSDTNKRKATRKRVADEGTKVPGEHSECETIEHKDVSLIEQEYKSIENSSQSGPASKRKQDTMTSKSSLGQTLESTSAILDRLDTESVKEKRLLTANANHGRKKRKKQKSNPGQGGSEISSAKEVCVDTFQAIEAINHKDLGSEADPGFVIGKIPVGGAISEPCLISSREVKETSRTDGVLHSEGDDDMDDTNDGNMESQNEAPEPDVVTVIKTRDSVDLSASHVDHHPTLVSHEGINVQNDIGVSGLENRIGKLEDKIVKSAKKMKKSKKTKDPVGRTEAVDAVRDRGPASDISPAECPTSVTGHHLSDNAKQDGPAEGKEESKMKALDSLPSVTDVRADDVIRDVLQSLQHCYNGPANTENMDNISRKKIKKQGMEPPELQGKDNADHQNPTILADNVSEVRASSKSTRKTVKVNSSSAAQLNGLDMGSNNNKGVGMSLVHAPVDSSQSTLKTNHDGRPLQDVASVEHPKSTCVDKANNSIEVPCESERIKSQHQHEIADSGEILIEKVTDKKGMETEVTGKKKKKKLEVQSGGSRSDLLSFQMLNGNQRKEVNAQAAKSSSILSPRSSLKVEPYSSKVQSSNTLLTISKSAAKEPLQTSDKTNSIPKEAQRPIDISSRVYTHVEKNNARAVSSSTVERSKNSTNLHKGGNERRSHLDIGKATGSNKGKVVNSLANKKSLLATTGTIFKHDDRESSDNEDGVENSDASTRTPSDISSSSEYSDNSDVNASSLRNGSYDCDGEEGGGRNRKKPGMERNRIRYSHIQERSRARSSSPKSMSLHTILRNSSRYKKAKLTASQDLDSQAEEFVPDSHAT